MIHLKQHTYSNVCLVLLVSLVGRQKEGLSPLLVAFSLIERIDWNLLSRRESHNLRSVKVQKIRKYSVTTGQRKTKYTRIFFRLFSRMSNHNSVWPAKEFWITPAGTWVLKCTLNWKISPNFSPWISSMKKFYMYNIFHSG